MSVKLDWDGDSSHDLVTKQFFEVTKGNFVIVTRALPPIGYETRIMGLGLNEAVVTTRHPSSPETAEREAIAEMGPIWASVEADIALAEKLEAQDRAALADSVEDE
jgi:hypothetical protein